MKKIVFLPVLSMALGLLSGCEYYKQKDQPRNGILAVPNVDGKTVSYQVARDAVFSKKCVMCHGTSGGVSLEDYESIMHNIGKIEQAIFNDSMPKAPNPPLSDEEKSLIRIWLDAGAPEYAQGETATPTPVPSPAPVLEAKFSSIKALIFEKKCIACHSVGQTAEKVPLVDYDQLLNSPRDLVLPKDADESGLVIAVERPDNKRMPPPSAGNPLSDDEMLIIRKWINAGAENN